MPNKLKMLIKNSNNNLTHTQMREKEWKIESDLHAGLERLGRARGIHGLCGGEVPGTVTEMNTMDEKKG